MKSLSRKQKIAYTMIFFGTAALVTAGVTGSVYLAKTSSSTELKIPSGVVFASNNSQSSILSNVQSTSNATKQPVSKTVVTDDTELTHITSEEIALTKEITKSVASKATKSVASESTNAVTSESTNAVASKATKSVASESTNAVTSESTNAVASKTTKSVIKNGHLNIKGTYSSKQKTIIYITVIVVIVLLLITMSVAFKIQKNKPKNEDLFTEMNQHYANVVTNTKLTMPSIYPNISLHQRNY